MLWLPIRGSGFQSRSGKRLRSRWAARGIPPEKVAEKVAHALTSRHPHFRYLVGKDAKARTFLEPLVPGWLRSKGVKRLLYGGKDSN